MSDLEALVLIALGFVFAGLSAFGMLADGPDSAELESRWADAKASESRVGRVAGAFRVGAWATWHSVVAILFAVILVGVSVLVLAVVGGVIALAVFGVVRLLQLLGF